MTSSPASTHEAALTLLLRQGEASAAELAQQLGVSVQVMRRHLRSLERDELVEASPQSGGPGRPSNRWRLTANGRGRFPDGSEHFALGLLQSLSTALPPDQVKGLLSTQADLQAGRYREQLGDQPLSGRLEKMVELRRREGYVADCRQDPESPAWLLQEYHCSVSRVAEAFPLICDQELQVMRRTFPDCSVERVHWKLDGDHTCGFRLTPLD
jgi:DeoR family suf operon transcriptional repressor